MLVTNGDLINGAEPVSVFSAQGGTGAALLTNTPVLVKANEVALQFDDLVNSGASGAWVQYFDAATAGAVTLGTTVPKFTRWVPATSARDKSYNTFGVVFFLGLVVAATATANGAGAPAAGISATLGYT